MKSSPNLKSKFSNPNCHHAFTLIELLVSVGIFTMMTALVVAKYGNFNQSVLMTNLAYDVALTIRTAQTYGLSVKNSDTTNSTAQFQHAYGVHFDTSSTLDTILSNGNKKNQELVLFVDLNDDGKFTDSNQMVSTYAIKRGAYISSVCIVSGCSYGDPDSYSFVKPGLGVVDVSFKRPDPDAKICFNSECNFPKYVEISIKGTDGSIRVVSVRSNGQISVQD